MKPVKSELGQIEKNSVRAYVFRFALELGHCSTQSACLKGAITGLMHRSDRSGIFSIRIARSRGVFSLGFYRIPDSSSGTEVTGYTGDDIAQPCMRRLVVKPAQPNHGGFDRFRRTRQSMENKGMRPCH